MTDEIDDLPALLAAKDKIQKRKDLQEKYEEAIATLKQVRDAQSLTNTQIVSALKYIARILVLLLKYIKSQE